MALAQDSQFLSENEVVRVNGGILQQNIANHVNPITSMKLRFGILVIPVCGQP